MSSNESPIGKARDNFGVRQVVSLLAQSGELAAERNIAPFNVAASGDNLTWYDKASAKAGDVVDLVSLVWSCSREEAAHQILDIFAHEAPETLITYAPSFEGGYESDNAEFPHKCLPRLLSEMAKGIVEMEGVPLVLAAGVLIASVSACLGSGIVVETKHDKQACGNLYLLMEAVSGSGKTGAFERAKAPIMAFESDLLKMQKAAVPKTRARLKMVDAEIKVLTNPAKSSDIPDAIERLAALEKEKIELE